MSGRIEREVQVPAPVDAVWDAVISDGWLADEVALDLVPGGDASFRWDDAAPKDGWVEDVRTPEDGGSGRLAFWWAEDDQPATRVEVTIAPDGSGAAVVRVLETRPLDRLDLTGTPLPGVGGTTYGPALVAA